MRITDQQAFETSRRLMVQHGLPCGVLTGAVVAAADLYAMEQLRFGQEPPLVVAIGEDHALHYTSTLLNDEWLLENQLLQSVPAATMTATTFGNVSTTATGNRGSLLATLAPFVVADMDLPPVTTVGRSTTLREAVDCMLEREFDQLPVVDGARKLVGYLTLGRCLV